MTATIDIVCSLPAPTLAQVRAWLTRSGWEVDTSRLAYAPQSECWEHATHGRAWVPREELVDWLAYVSDWIANRAWQVESTPEAVYRDIVGPAKVCVAHFPSPSGTAFDVFATRDAAEHAASFCDGATVEEREVRP